MSTLEYISAPSDSLTTKLENRTAKIGVIGLGYVGLPLVLLFSEQDFRITGFDIDAKKVEVLTRGGSYIVRIPETEIQVAKDKGFTATADYSQIANMDAIVICVPTPLDDHHEPDLSFIEATAEAIVPYLRARQLVVLESTTYPGTTEELLIPILEKNPLGLKAARGDEDTANTFYVAFSPEREDPGNDTVARCDIPKVVGGLNPAATEFGRQMYGTIFHKTVPVSTPAAAEMTKLLENIYRCVNIALVNELKLLSLRMGIDIWEVIAAASTKPFGFQPFYPGPGLGGHCIPIDPYYLTWKAREAGMPTRFIELAGEVNRAMPEYEVNRVALALNDRGKAVKGSKVLVLGLAYKPDVDDVRESPSFELIEKLEKLGAHVDYNDPHVAQTHKMRRYDLQMQSVPLTPQSLASYDCVLIATHHAAYDWQLVADHAKLIVDTRNALKNVKGERGHIVSA